MSQTPEQSQAQLRNFFAYPMQGDERQFIALIESVDITSSLREVVFTTFLLRRIKRAEIDIDRDANLYFLTEPEGIFGNQSTRMRLERTHYFRLLKHEMEADQQDNQAENILKRDRDRLAHFRSDIFAREFRRVYGVTILPSPQE